MSSGSPNFCRQCGDPVDLGDRFCANCGLDQLPGVSSPPPADPATPPQGTAAVPPPPSPIIQPAPKRSRRAALVALIVGVVVIVAAGAVIGTIELTKRSPSTKISVTGATRVTSKAIQVGAYKSFERAYASVKRDVVKITTTGCDGTGYEGSGFVVDAHHIVTAAHVVEGSKSVTVTIAGNSIPTQIIGLDSSGDVALLQSDTAIPGPYVPLSTSPPAVGESVAAIGFPLDAGLTMTQGTVSAQQQSIQVNDTTLSGLVQTDTPINHGNSGGPLLSLDGYAVGIVDALNTEANATGYAINPGYAASEVSHWIEDPESHPLPLCSSPNPLGVAASPAPTPPAAPSTGAGNAIAAVPLTAEGTSAMQVAQSLATALASQEWNLARSIYPELGSDSELATAYGGLDQSTVVVTGESDSGSTVNLTGAYVAWENVNGGQRTSIYCIGWQIDTSAQVVDNQSSIDTNLIGYANQWVDPSTTVATVLATCTP